MFTRDSLFRRRIVAIVEEVAKEAGSDLGATTFDAPEDFFTPPQRAALLGDRGADALTYFLTTAVDPYAQDTRHAKEWKLVDRRSGLSAAVYLAHGLAEMLGRTATYLDAQKFQDARTTLLERLPWTGVDEADLQKAVGDLGEDAEALESARMSLAVGGVSRAISHERAAQLPGFRLWFEGDATDRFEVHLAWNAAFATANRRMVRAIDPTGYAEWERRTPDRSRT